MINVKRDYEAQRSQPPAREHPWLRGCGADRASGCAALLALTVNVSDVVPFELAECSAFSAKVVARPSINAAARTRVLGKTYSLKVFLV